MNFWNKLMGDEESAGSYMISYGEGPGSPLRQYIGNLINESESVLDVGCGPGHNYDHFREYGPCVVYKGYDYASFFVNAANKRVGSEVFHVGDVRNIKEPDKSWDVVLLQDVLEHTNGYEKPVIEALRVARKRILVTFWHLTENDDHINDDGNDGWGAWYSQPKWDKFLDSLDLSWLHDEIPRQNGVHDIYIIDLEGK